MAAVVLVDKSDKSEQLLRGNMSITEATDMAYNFNSSNSEDYPFRAEVRYND